MSEVFSVPSCELHKSYLCLSQSPAIGKQSPRGIGVELEYSTIETNGVRLHVVQAGTKNGPRLCCCTAFRNFGMDKHNPQNGLVLTKRFIISPSRITQNGPS